MRATGTGVEAVGRGRVGWAGGGRSVVGKDPAVNSPCMVLLQCAGPLARTAQWKCAVARKGCCTHHFL